MGGRGGIYVERYTEFSGIDLGFSCGGPQSVALPRWLVYEREDGGMVTGPVGGHVGHGNPAAIVALLGMTKGRENRNTGPGSGTKKQTPYVATDVVK